MSEANVRQPLYGAAARRMRDQLREPITLDALPPAVTELLAAVVEALTVPLPSIDDADERAYHRLLERRTTDVRIMLESMLDYPDVDISRDAEDLRARTDTTPVTYALYEPERGEGR